MKRICKNIKDNKKLLLFIIGILLINYFLAYSIIQNMDGIIDLVCIYLEPKDSLRYLVVVYLYAYSYLIAPVWFLEAALTFLVVIFFGGPKLKRKSKNPS